METQLHPQILKPSFCLLFFTVYKGACKRKIQHEDAQWNSSNPIHVQQLSTLSKNYPLLCVILLFPLQEYCAKSQIIKWSTRPQIPMKTNNIADSYQGIAPRASFEHPFSALFPWVSIQKMQVVKLHICVEICADNGHSSERSSYVHWTQQHHVQPQSYISVRTFLYGNSLLRFPLSEFTLLTYSSEPPCIKLEFS